MSEGRKRLGIVIPMFNEEGNVDELVSRFESVFDAFATQFDISRDSIDVLFVDDGSTDGTWEKVCQVAQRYPYYRGIRFSRNFGHELATTAGIDLLDADAIAIIDADLQDPPEFLLEMYKKLQEGFDVVYAVRKRRDDEPFWKLFTASIFYRFMNMISDVKIPIDTGDFRIMSRRVVDQLRTLRERHRFIRGLISWTGFNQVGLEYDRHKRFAGRTKYSFLKLLNLAWESVTSFSIAPLKVASFTGMLVAVLGILYAMRIVWLKIIHPHSGVPGWATIVVSVLVLGGVQLIALGIMGEYIGRINNEVKNRPLYIIKEKTE